MCVLHLIFFLVIWYDFTQLGKKVEQNQSRKRKKIVKHAFCIPLRRRLIISGKILLLKSFFQFQIFKLFYMFFFFKPEISYRSSCMFSIMQYKFFLSHLTFYYMYKSNDFCSYFKRWMLNFCIEFRKNHFNRDGSILFFTCRLWTRNSSGILFDLMTRLFYDC